MSARIGRAWNARCEGEKKVKIKGGCQTNLVDMPSSVVCREVVGASVVYHDIVPKGRFVLLEERTSVMHKLITTVGTVHDGY